jgi:hypothetical protein
VWIRPKTDHRGDPKVVQQEKDSESHDKLEMMLFLTNEEVNVDSAKKCKPSFLLFISFCYPSWNGLYLFGSLSSCLAVEFPSVALESFWWRYSFQCEMNLNLRKLCKA